MSLLPKILKAIAAAALLSGCNNPRQASQVGSITTDLPPESTYRRFMLALLMPDEPTIRQLILDNPDAQVLWEQGNYPVEVAALLAKQYREMRIERLHASPASDPDDVLLESSAYPLPVTVIKRDGAWKVDAGELIRLRRKIPKS